MPNQNYHDDENYAKRALTKGQMGKAHTLESGIDVLVGINVLVGKFVKTNKRTGWNKRTVGKIEPKYCLIIPILFVNFLLSLEV